MMTKMRRNVAAALLLVGGLALATWAVLDWIGYTGFTLSLVWK
jgi:hypothetical protein